MQPGFESPPDQIFRELKFLAEVRRKSGWIAQVRAKQKMDRAFGRIEGFTPPVSPAKEDKAKR